MCVDVGHLGAAAAVEGRWHGEPATRRFPLQDPGQPEGRHCHNGAAVPHPGYISGVDEKQEVMIGYSDTTIPSILSTSTVGGGVGRGVNPNMFDAVVSHVPGTINGQFHITE